MILTVCQEAPGSNSFLSSPKLLIMYLTGCGEFMAWKLMQEFMEFKIYVTLQLGCWKFYTSSAGMAPASSLLNTEN